MLGAVLVTSLLVSALVAGNITEDDTEGELYQSTCRGALGMQSGEIPDSALSASSEYDKKSVGALNSRIRTERNGGAWCPKIQIAKDAYEWIQVDLDGLHVITHVETQGRFGNGQGMEYAPHYLVDYQREENGRWIRFRDVKGNEIIPGNSNTYLAVTRQLHPPIIARSIRLVPYSVHPRTICMRLELLGCPWSEGVSSYSMRQGDRRGQEVDLYDFTYDGEVRDGYLSGGLGQLLDWETGQANFRLDTHGVGKKGYEWVGWKNDTLSAPADVRFEFDGVYNFSAIKIHCNNMFSKDIMVFSKALVYFSIGGKYYSGQPVLFEYMRDELIEFPRFVVIPIPYRLGRYVKIEMFYSKRWIMISEVRFENEYMEGNFTEETAPPPEPSTPLPLQPSEQHPHLVEVDILSKEKGFVQDTKGNKKPIDEILDNPAEAKTMDDTYIGVIIGALSALILILIMIVAIVIIRHRRNKYGGSSPLKMFVGNDHINFNLNDLGGPEKVNNGNMYKGVAIDESMAAEFSKNSGSMKKYLNNQGSDEAIQNRKLPDLPKTPDSTDTSTYATPLVVNLPPHPIFQSPVSPKESTPPPPPPPPHPDPWAICKALDPLSIQGLSGTSMYAVPDTVPGTYASTASAAASASNAAWLQEDLPVLDFPQDCLRHIEKLGEGEFGEVHLFEAHVGEQEEEEMSGSRGASRTCTMLVAVKTLRSSVCKQTRMDFMREVKIMSRLKDPNIVQVLGVCRHQDPLSVVVEFMKFGDLNQFLRHHMPETATNLPVDAPTLSYGSLIYMATQIASGMKYIESQNMVHRDLATRNCLVGSNYTIKISDFGMSRSLYSSDYYRIEGKAVLPIRWMAWESVLLGTFSPKSDVWSFGVTLWEILTFARDQPFDQLSDEQVIENCGHYYRQDAQQVLLPAPVICPKEIFDLVCECWNREDKSRPSFREIHMFLQRKNMGYNACEEKQINSLPIA